MGERKSQVKVKMQLGGKHGKEKPKINLDLKVKSQSSTESEKKSMKNIEAVSVKIQQVEKVKTEERV